MLNYVAEGRHLRGFENHRTLRLASSLGGSRHTGNDKRGDDTSSRRLASDLADRK